MKNLMIVGLVIPFLMVGCASTSTSGNDASGGKVVSAPNTNENNNSTNQADAAKKAEADRLAAEAAAAAEAKAKAERDRLAAEKLAQINALNNSRSVYFDFNQYEVNPSYQNALKAHAAYVQTNNQKVTVEGNTDDRGSREYNLALGQRRAVAVANILKTYGVSDAQIETISLGEEKPKAEGEGEAAWSQNRRADVQYSVE